MFISALNGVVDCTEIVILDWIIIFFKEMFDYIAVRCFIPYTALSKTFFFYYYFSCFTKQWLLQQ